MTSFKITRFRRRLLRWYRCHARDFPWRENPTPYKALVGEMLLQRTGVETVWPVFARLMEKYPDIDALARARLGDLKRIMRPLGLFYRADRLREVARQIVRDYDGIIPDTQKELLAMIKANLIDILSLNANTVKRIRDPIPQNGFVLTGQY